MKKGEVFTLDLFNAYAIFLVIVLVMTLLINSVFTTSQSREEHDKMIEMATIASDYLVYSDELNIVPYLFDKNATDLFFAQPSEDIAKKLGIYGYNYSIKVMQLHGDILVLEAGTDTNNYDRAVSLKRAVMYDNKESIMVVKIWEKR